MLDTAQSVLIGSATAIVAIGVVLAFTFAFVLAPLFIGAGFVLVLLVYQLVRRSAARR